jgi:hypothetical protein
MRLSDTLGAVYRKKIVDHVILIQESDIQIRDADPKLPPIEYIDVKFDSSLYSEPEYTAPGYFSFGFEYSTDGYVEYGYFFEGAQPLPMILDPVGWHSQDYKEVAAEIVEKVKTTETDVKTTIQTFTRNVRGVVVTPSVHEASAFITKREVTGAPQRAAVIGSIAKQFAMGSAMAIYSAVRPVVHQRTWRTLLPIKLEDFKVFSTSFSGGASIDDLAKNIVYHPFTEGLQASSVFSYVTRFKRRFLEPLIAQSVRLAFFSTIYKNEIDVNEQIGNLFVKSLIDPTLLRQDYCVSRYVNDDYFENKIWGKHVFISSVLRSRSGFISFFDIPIDSLCKNVFRLPVVDDILVYSVFEGKITRMGGMHVPIFDLPGGNTLIKGLPHKFENLLPSYVRAGYVEDDYYSGGIAGKFVVFIPKISSFFSTSWVSGVNPIDNFIPKFGRLPKSGVPFVHLVAKQVHKPKSSPVVKTSIRNKAISTTKALTSQIGFTPKMANWIFISLQSHVSAGFRGSRANSPLISSGIKVSSSYMSTGALTENYASQIYSIFTSSYVGVLRYGYPIEVPIFSDTNHTFKQGPQTEIEISDHFTGVHSEDNG